MDDSSKTEAWQSQAQIITIVEHGDVVLNIKHTIGGQTQEASFRCDRASLSSKSAYFERLLGGRYGEGSRINEELATLRTQYAQIKDVPVDKLPTISIEDLGRTSAIKSVQPLLTDFFSILSGKDIHAVPPVANLANLAVVADRFDALNAVAHYIKRKKIPQAIDGKTNAKQDAALTEEKMRQRLLVGLLLEHAPWIEKFSARLIVQGTALRDENDDDALWWELSGRIEDELAFRRRCVLETIQDVQSHFVRAYSFRERQCRLGYDSSPECDSFQFGEMVRFFLKAGTLRMQGTLLGTLDEQPGYTGDIHALIERLKQIPEYQVDRNHSHCGIRTRIIPVMDLILSVLRGIGICGECWRQGWSTHAWIESKRPLTWKKQQRLDPRSANDHESKHDVVRSLFMAVSKDWAG